MQASPAGTDLSKGETNPTERGRFDVTKTKDQRYGVLSTFTGRDLLAAWQVLTALCDEDDSAVSHGAFAASMAVAAEMTVRGMGDQPDGSRSLRFDRTVAMVSS